MGFVNRNAFRHTVNLARAGKHHPYLGVMQTACLQDLQLRLGVDSEIGLGILHRVDMAGLTGEVEEIVHASNQVLHGMNIPHIRNIDPDLVFDGFHIPKIPAIGGNEAVHQRYIRAKFHQPDGEIRPNEAQPACN